MENANITEQPNTLKELAAIRTAATHTARTGEGGSVNEENETELPSGGLTSAAAETNETSAETPAEASAAAPDEAGELIKIGDKEFKSQAEAIKYAEQLETEKLINESYSAGIREALRAQAQPVAQEAAPEENFEEKFYADPKGTLKEVQAKATQDAIAQIKAEQTKEKLWNQFFDENPDLAGHRFLCEITLQQNWDTLGAITDIPKAMKILATKTRAIFQEYNERAKPRTELAKGPARVVSSGGGAPASVTQTKKDDPPLTLAQQMRQLRR